MRQFNFCFLFLVIVMLMSAESFAQPGQRGGGMKGRGQQGGMMQRLPIMAALDQDKNSVISSSEIANASQSLLTLDKNNNGKIDPSEMQMQGGFGGRGRGGQGRGKGSQGGGSSTQVFEFLAGKYDKDKDGKISAQEYDRGKELFAKLDKNEDGFVTVEDFQVATARGRRDRVATTAPTAGNPAPDFELTLVTEAEKTVKLSSFTGKQPVALIFGSCT